MACRVACFLSISMGRDVIFSLKFRLRSDEEIPDNSKAKRSRNNNSNSNGNGNGNDQPSSSTFEGYFYRTETEHRVDEFSEYDVPGKCYAADIYCCMVVFIFLSIYRYY